MILYKRRLTQLDGKMDPVLRVAYKDVGKMREHGCGSFACKDGKDCSRQSHCISTIHGGHSKKREHGCGSFAYKEVCKMREHGCGSFAYREVGKEREHGCGSFAYREVGKEREHGCGSFDWHFFRVNSNNKISVNRPLA